MTLTFKTAKHAIGKNGEVSRIVERFDELTNLDDNALTRAEAEDIHEYAPDFKPCVVVTTAREAFEAAWELAHEIKGDTVPSKQAYIYRDGLPFLYTVNTYGYAYEPEGSILDHGEHRLLDSPEPEPTTEPEPWTLSRFCYADGDIYKRFHDASGVHWMRPGHERYYRRKDLAKRNPKPVTIEGESE